MPSENEKEELEQVQLDGECPRGWHVPLSCTVIGNADEYEYRAPQSSLGNVSLNHEDSPEDADALAGIQWVYDTSGAASMVFFEPGDFVWVTGAPHPLGGVEEGWLLGTVQQCAGVQQAKGRSIILVMLKYHETSVIVPAEESLAVSAPSLPAQCSKVYPKDKPMPLPLAALLYYGLPDAQKTGFTTANVVNKEPSGLWRVLHRLDKKDEETGVVSLCRHSLFHQLRNLARQVQRKLERDREAATSTDSAPDRDLLAYTPDGVTVSLPSGEKAVLHHAYSESVLSWVYGENSGGSGTQAARHTLESDKLVDTAELEALATIIVKKNFLAAGLALKTAMSPVVARRLSIISRIFRGKL